MSATYEGSPVFWPSVTLQDGSEVPSLVIDNGAKEKLFDNTLWLRRSATRARSWQDWRAHRTDYLGGALGCGGSIRPLVFADGSAGWYFPNLTNDEVFLATAPGGMVSEPIAAGSQDIALQIVASAKIGTDVVLAGGLCNAPGTFGGVYRSTTHGDSWSDVALTMGATDYCHVQGIYEGTLAAQHYVFLLGQTRDGSTNYGAALWTSTDQGASFGLAATYVDTTAHRARYVAAYVTTEDFILFRNRHTGPDCAVTGLAAGSAVLPYLVRAAAHNTITGVALIVDSTGLVYRADDDDPLAFSAIAQLSIGDYDTGSLVGERMGSIEQSCILRHIPGDPSDSGDTGTWVLFVRDPGVLLVSDDNGENWYLYDSPAFPALVFDMCSSGAGLLNFGGYAHRLAFTCNTGSVLFSGGFTESRALMSGAP